METTSPNSFGQLLKQFRYMMGMSQAELAVRINYSPSAISNWERGRATPEGRHSVINIGRALELTAQQLNELLFAAGYPPMDVSSTISTTPARNTETGHDMVTTTTAARTQNEAVREFQVQIQDLRSLVEILSERIDNADNTTGDLNSLRDELLDIREVVSEIQTTGREITAPVSMPPRRQLEVKLIPMTTFNNLEEHRSDENKWYSWTAMFAGAILGIIVNLATGAEASTTTWVILGTFLVVGLFAFWQARMFTNRAKYVKQELLGQDNQEIVSP